jgi:hypothetical protein
MGRADLCLDWSTGRNITRDELLSILPALPAVYSGAPQSVKPKSAAISYKAPRFVNLSPRQTPPVGRGIQISARSVSGYRRAAIAQRIVSLRSPTAGISKTSSAETATPAKGPL